MYFSSWRKTIPIFKSTSPHCIHVHIEKGVVLHYNKPKSRSLAMFG